MRVGNSGKSCMGLVLHGVNHPSKNFLKPLFKLKLKVSIHNLRVNRGEGSIIHNNQVRNS